MDTANERTMVRAMAYWDEQDPHDKGWAYRLQYSDGHEESGDLDVRDEEDTQGAAYMLWAVLRAYGGECDVDYDHPDFAPQHDGSILWRAS